MNGASEFAGCCCQQRDRAFTSTMTLWVTVRSVASGLLAWFLWLHEEFFWVRHQIPPVGLPRAPSSPLPSSPSLLVLVRGTQGPSEESLIKMKYIRLSICSSDKHAILPHQQSLPICFDHLKLDSSFVASMLYVFFHPFSVLLHPHFRLIFMFFTVQFRATPQFYSSVSSPSLWERPKICKRPLICSRLDLTLHISNIGHADRTSGLRSNIVPDVGFVGLQIRQNCSLTLACALF